MDKRKGERQKKEFEFLTCINTYWNWEKKGRNNRLKNKGNNWSRKMYISFLMRKTKKKVPDLSVSTAFHQLTFSTKMNAERFNYSLISLSLIFFTWTIRRWNMWRWSHGKPETADKSSHRSWGKFSKTPTPHFFFLSPSYEAHRNIWWTLNKT